jgi:hypothetical protein
LGWAPIGTREGLIEKAIVPAIKHYLR